MLPDSWTGFVTVAAQVLRPAIVEVIPQVQANSPEMELVPVMAASSSTTANGVVTVPPQVETPAIVEVIPKVQFKVPEMELVPVMAA